MSIMKQYRPTDPPAKRRKLSHSSDNDAHSNSDGGSEAESDAVTKDAVQARPDGRKGRKSKTTTDVARHSVATSLLGQGGTSGSSVLAVQLEELVRAQTPKYATRLAKLRHTIDRLESLIKAVPATAPTSVSHARKAMRKAGVLIPFPGPAPDEDSNLKFGYEEPTSIRLTGSLPQETGVKGNLEINLILEMPQSLLQQKDYLNLRAFHKRAFYLACVAAAFKSDARDEFEIKYVLLDDVALLPALRVTHKSESMQKKSRHETAMFISVAFPSGAFPLEKVLPARNCVRSESSIGDSPEPTPFYNSCLCMQASLEKYDGMIAEAKVSCSAFLDACRAGQTWLQQRGFSSAASAGGFGVFEWAVMSALLLRTGGHRGHPLFSDRYNSLQLFKAMLQVLASRDMTEGWCLNGEAEVPKADVPTLIDVRTGVNVLYKMSPWAYQNLRHEAQISLEAVNSKQEDNFESAFILKTATLVLKYDEVFSMSISPVIDDYVHEQRTLLHKLYGVLKRGLGDRVSIIDLSSAGSQPCSVRKSPSLSGKSFDLQVALITTPDSASRLIDHGPPADDREACVEFRSFWGDRSELRRFRDGSINESVTWSPDEPVTIQILRHVLERHFQAPNNGIVAHTIDLEGQILPGAAGVVATDAFKVVNDQFQTLSSTLHQLEGLPLAIRSVSPADPALRSCSITPPLLSRSPEPVSVLIQFDTSTRWPDSLPAIQYTKIAFLIKLSDLLTSSSRELNTRIGLENTPTATSGHLNTSFLDITYPSPSPTISPITFRLRIHHDRELHLLQTALSTKTIPPLLRTTLSSALHIHKRTLALPPHTNALRSLCTRFPPLSPTIRLLKKWLSSHLLLHHIPAEAIEIIAASIFIRPYPWSVPGSATIAFLRCLHFLGRWDWANQPLVVDLGLAQDMGLKVREGIRVGFEAWRRLDPGWNQVTWFVGTSLDETGVVWTRGRVERVVAGRVRALAGAVLEVVERGGLGVRGWEALFVAEVAEFDFVLGLKADVVRGARWKGEKDGFKNLQLVEQVGWEEVGFDPVKMYVEDLEKAFGNVAMFFYDGEGGKVIAGLWRPSVKGQREWRVRMGWSTKLVSKSVGGEADVEGAEGKVMSEANLRGMLKEMEMMGEGIVKSAEMIKA